MFARNNKYQYIAVLQGNYGYGWEDEVFYNQHNPRDMRDLRDDLRAYRSNCPMFGFRVIHRRIPTEEWFAN